MDGHLDCFPFLAIANHAVMNMSVKYLLEFLLSILWGHVTRSRIAGSYGSSV